MPPDWSVAKGLPSTLEHATEDVAIAEPLMAGTREC